MSDDIKNKFSSKSSLDWLWPSEAPGAYFEYLRKYGKEHGVEIKIHAEPRFSNGWQTLTNRK